MKGKVSDRPARKKTVVGTNTSSLRVMYQVRNPTKAVKKQERSERHRDHRASVVRKE